LELGLVSCANLVLQAGFTTSSSTDAISVAALQPLAVIGVTRSVQLSAKYPMQVIRLGSVSAITTLAGLQVVANGAIIVQSDLVAASGTLTLQSIASSIFATLPLSLNASYRFATTSPLLSISAVSTGICCLCTALQQSNLKIRFGNC
jgi:hypothetical protein